VRVAVIDRGRARLVCAGLHVCDLAHCEGNQLTGGGLAASAEQVGKEAIGTGDKFRELAVEGEGDIDISSLARMGDEQAAALGILAWVSGFNEGDVAGVPVVREAVATLFRPIR